LTSSLVIILSYFNLPMPKNSLITLASDQSREGLNLTKVGHAFTLPFRPAMTRTIVPQANFVDLDFEKILAQSRGLVIDVDATLVAHHSNEFSPEVLDMLQALRHVIKICIFSNNNQLRQPLIEMDLPFVTNVKPKPHPDGFDIAARKYLGHFPENCTMIGDNLLTDGGALRAGLKLALTNPVPGPEGLGHRVTRSYGHLVKKVHDSLANR